MNGIHDMGGLHGFGLVVQEKNEPVFHSHWESRIFCITQVLDTKEIWNLDEHRHEIELMNAADSRFCSCTGTPPVWALSTIITENFYAQHD